MFFSKSKALLKQREEDLMVVQNELFTLKANHQVLEASLQEIKNALAIAEADLKTKTDEHAGLAGKYAGIIDLDKVMVNRKMELETCEKGITELNEKYTSALTLFKELEKRIGIYQDSLEITEYGLYQPQYNFDLPEQYKLELESIYQQQKSLIAAELAVKCFTEWEVGGSKVEGKKMTKKYTKLMLYAFNGECDATISKVKWNNIAKTELRIL
jgi:hypothetical protein